MLMEVLFWFPTVRTVTCWGGALGAAGGKTRQSRSTNQAHFIVLSRSNKPSGRRIQWEPLNTLQQGRLNLHAQVHSRNCRGTISLLW